MRHVKFLFFIAYFLTVPTAILKTTLQNPPGNLGQRNDQFKPGRKKKSGKSLKAS